MGGSKPRFSGGRCRVSKWLLLGPEIQRRNLRRRAGGNDMMPSMSTIIFRRDRPFRDDMTCRHVTEILDSPTSWPGPRRDGGIVGPDPMDGSISLSCLGRSSLQNCSLLLTSVFTRHYFLPSAHALSDKSLTAAFVPTSNSSSLFFFSPRLFLL